MDQLSWNDSEEKSALIPNPSASFQTSTNESFIHYISAEGTSHHENHAPSNQKHEFLAAQSTNSFKVMNGNVKLVKMVVLYKHTEMGSLLE